MMGAMFKIGDRVRCVESEMGLGKGLIGTVVESSDVHVGVDFGGDFYGHGNNGHHWHFYSPSRQLVVESPITIRAGRYYRTRGGQKVGPMEVYSKDYWHDSATGDLWRLDGSEVYDPQDDLIAEWVDEPAADAKVAGSNDNGTAGFTIPIMDDEDAEPDSKLVVSISADTFALDTEIDRVLRRLKKLKKKARKLGFNLEYSWLLSAA